MNDVIATIRNDNPDTVEQFEGTYKIILEQTLNVLPHTQIVLYEPFIVPVSRVKIITKIWHVVILKRQKIDRTLAETYHTTFIRLQKQFNDACQKAPANYWIWDGIHPCYQDMNYLPDLR